ncbi:hypothetical protein CBS101457_003540 [Exobasidium rhododendri]|nr:hypothetical protein CBS101457_003540 [Exobasidium rhododendri]
MEERESQVMEVAACDLSTARVLLQRNGDDVQAAIMAFYSTVPADLGQAQQSSQNAAPADHDYSKALTTWNDPASTPIGPQTQSTAFEQDWGTYDLAASKPERTSKKRNTPVDLTGDDEDDDFRKAMQASLESETSRQKKQQDYGYKTRSGAIAASDDDDALSRAIEASMQQDASMTRAQTPQSTNQNLDSLGGFRLRAPEQPVIIVPPNPFLSLFSSAIQALYAARPFRQALLSLKLHDFRLADGSPATMENYWQGQSPNGVTLWSDEAWRTSMIVATEEQRGAVEATIRLLTLFVFLTYTKRPICLAEDVISHPAKSNYAYVMNSSRRPASDVASCHVSSTIETIITAVDCLNRTDNLDDSKSMMKNACLSYTAAGVAPQSDEPKNLRRPKDHYEVTVHQLIHNNVNTSVHKALYAHLSDDKSLYTSTASTLFFSLGRFGAGALPMEFGNGSSVKEEIASFQVESVLYLDQFMFEKRNGVRLGLDSEKVKGHLSKIEELEKYKRSIGWHQGTDARTLLRDSLRYFEEICHRQDADRMRLESIKEAGVRLSKMSSTLEREIERVDAHLKREQTAVEAERKAIMGGFLEGLADPQLQSIRYDLQAVMMNNEQMAWSYVKHDDHYSRDPTTPSSTAWWKICDGAKEQVTEADVLGDPNTASFFIYTRHEERCEEEAPLTGRAVEATGGPSAGVDGTPNKTIRLDTVMNWWAKTPLVDCIEADNASFGTQLAEMVKVKYEQEQDSEVTMHDVKES